MNQMEQKALKAFASIGWQTGTDEVGDPFIWRSEGDTELHVLLKVRQYTKDQGMRLGAHTESLQFSEIKSRIFSPLRYFNGIHEKDFERTSVKIDADDITDVSEELISWWKEQDNLQGIKAMKTDYVPEVTYRQVQYLSALAFLGDFVPLLEYQEAFKKGNHLNFSPAIDIEMLNRAIDIALERS